MTRRWMFPLTMVLAACLWLVNSTCVFACSCLPPGTPQEEAARSDVVFSGKATQQTAGSGALDGSESIKIAFEIGQVWKGSVPQSLIVETSGSSASCGYTFETGQEYLVYAQTVEGQLSVSLCSRTMPLAQAQEDLAALGQGSQPTAASPTPTAESDGGSRRSLIIAGLVVVAALASLGGWRYARRG